MYSVTRDASYTTQPLELLNALGFEKNKILIKDFEINGPDSSSPKGVDNHKFDASDYGTVPTSSADSTGRTSENNQQPGLQLNSDGSEG